MKILGGGIMLRLALALLTLIGCGLPQFVRDSSKSEDSPDLTSMDSTYRQEVCTAEVFLSALRQHEAELALPSSVVIITALEIQGSGPTNERGLQLAIPSNAIPSNALPSSALPANALPANALPASAIPSNALPSSALPASLLEEAPVQIMPSNASSTGSWFLDAPPTSSPARLSWWTAGPCCGGKGADPTRGRFLGRSGY